MELDAVDVGSITSPVVDSSSNSNFAESRNNNLNNLYISKSFASSELMKLHIDNQNHVYGAIPNGDSGDIELGERRSTTSTSSVPAPTFIPLGFDNDISIIANTMNALLGVSIFAMPWGYLQSGIVGGSFLVIIVCFLSFETARILLIAQRRLYDRTGVIKSYPEIAGLTLGEPLWSSVVTIATIISCIGGCIGYLIFLGETVGQLFSISLLSSILLTTIPLILLSWIRSFKNLTVFTVTSVVAIVLAVIAIIYDGTVRMKGPVEDTPMITSVPSTLRFLGPATFLFTIHYCVLSMGAETLHEKIDEDLVQHLAHDVHHQRNVLDLDTNCEVVSLPIAPQLTRPLIIAYAISAALISILGGGGFLVYQHAEIVK